MIHIVEEIKLLLLLSNRLKQRSLPGDVEYKWGLLLGTRVISAKLGTHMTIRLR
jgi:hypothetical protein